MCDVEYVVIVTFQSETKQCSAQPATAKPSRAQLIAHMAGTLLCLTVRRGFF